jgi:S-adenosylmethionine:tRNA ribosyltransferase-isomerase
VVNDTRVIPARVRFTLDGHDAEILLLHEVGADTWAALTRPSRLIRQALRFDLPGGLAATVVAERPDGERTLRFDPPGRLREVLDDIGELPLPPYIHEPLADPSRYQTVYAAPAGWSVAAALRLGAIPEEWAPPALESAAAPTAGLHFDAAMLDRLRAAGVEIAPLTLRVGLDTFRPVRVEDLDDHRMHSEAYAVPAATRALVAACRRRGGRVVAVGTTVCRTLEAAAATGRDAGSTDIFIRPGFEFRATDLLLTNFHLPKSTLLVMVAAFSGRERILAAYREAVARGYRFFSFGDCMLLEPAPGGGSG